MSKETNKLLLNKNLFFVLTGAFSIILIFLFGLQTQATHNEIIITVILLTIIIFFLGYVVYVQFNRKLIYKQLFLSEKQLREHLGEYRAILYSICDGVMTTDSEGKIKKMNAVAEKITGWKLNEAIAKPCEEIFRIINDECRKQIEIKITENIAALPDNINLISKNGDEIPIAVSFSPIKSDSAEISGNVIIFRDQSQERFAAKILQTRLNFIEFTNSHTLNEILQKAIDEIGALTSSPIGFFHFIESDQITNSLHSSANGAFIESQMVKVEGILHGIDKDSAIAKCLHSRKPVIINDSLSIRDTKGLPEGHPCLKRELVIPIIRSGQIVAIVAVGNKSSEYGLRDIEIVTFLSDVAWDAIEKRQNENAIRVSELRLRRAELISNSGNWEIHMKTNTVVASAGARKIYGLEKEVLDYESVKHIPLSKYRSLLNRSLKNLIDHKQPYDVEFQISTADTGEMKYIHSIANYDHENEILFGVIQDITDYKLAQIELFEKNEELDRYFNASLDLLCIASPEGTFLRLNPEWEKVLGFQLSELEGKAFLDFVHPDDIERTKSLIFKEQSEISRFENRYRCQDGSYRWIEWRSKQQGSKIFAVARDMTDRKSNEIAIKDREKFISNLLEILPVAVFYKDKTGKYLNVNNAYLKLLGLNKESVIDKNVFDIHPSDLANFFFQKDMEMIKNPVNQHFETRLIDVSGREYSVIIHKTVTRNSRNEITGLVGAVVDMTQLKQTEANLVNLNNKLKALNATKDKLFSIIAHDLKSPLSGILGLAELLDENINNYSIYKTQSFMQEITYTTKNTLKLLENLLSWAKSQTGQLEFFPEELSLHSIIEEVVEIFNNRLKIKNISLIYSQIDNISVYADKNMLQTILRNLIANAVKFTSNGGIVEINAISEKDKIEISIKDNGIGMNRETQDMLFKIDSYFTTTGTLNEKGSGLGLILCKEFIEKNGGEINVYSEPGNGSDFRFSLMNMHQ